MNRYYYLNDFIYDWTINSQIKINSTNQSANSTVIDSYTKAKNELKFADTCDLNKMSNHIESDNFNNKENINKSIIKNKCKEDIKTIVINENKKQIISEKNNNLIMNNGIFDKENISKQGIYSNTTPNFFDLKINNCESNLINTVQVQNDETLLQYPVNNDLMNKDKFKENPNISITDKIKIENLVNQSSATLQKKSKKENKCFIL